MSVFKKNRRLLAPVFYICRYRAPGLFAVTLLVFAATGARIIVADILQRVARGLLHTVAAIRTMDVAMLMMMIVPAVGAVHMGLIPEAVYGGRDSMTIDAARQKSSPRKGNIDARPPCPDIF